MKLRHCLTKEGKLLSNRANHVFSVVRPGVQIVEPSVQIVDPSIHIVNSGLQIIDDVSNFKECVSGVITILGLIKGISKTNRMTIACDKGKNRTTYDQAM